MPISPRRTPLVALLALCAVLAPAQAMRAQNNTPAGKRQLVGIVRDAAGAALPDVTVAIFGLTVRTDVRGAFELFTVDVDTVTISLRKIGFEQVDALLSARNRLWDTVMVQMEPTSQRLSKVKVTETSTRSALGLRDFEERRARGLGTFITRADITERGANRLSDLLRTKRGVVIVGRRVRFAAYSGSRTQLCQPVIWMDGSLSAGMEVDELLPSTVEAMELYPYLSTIPMEFQRLGANTTPCGTIVIWTRIPNGKAR